MNPTSRLFSTIHGLLSRPLGFLEPRELNIDVFYGKDGERLMIGINRPPRVIMVTDKLLRLWDPEAPMLEELGYVLYDRNVLWRGSYYARRPWVYLFKARAWVQRRLVRLQSWTYRKLWHSHNQEGTKFSWRDLRPGPGRLCQAQEAARTLQTQILNQYTRIGKLESERERAHDQGMVEGWESHKRVAELYIDDVVQKAKD